MTIDEHMATDNWDMSLEKVKLCDYFCTIDIIELIHVNSILFNHLIHMRFLRARNNLKRPAITLPRTLGCGI